MRTKLLKITLSVVALLLFATVQPAYARRDTSSSITLSAIDTVANFETVITVSGLAVSEQANVTVVKPDGERAALNGRADAQGRAQIVFSDSETHSAGTYTASLSGYDAVSAFQVFPGEVSATASGAYASKAAVQANGADFAEITVRSVDEFGNPLQFHGITVTSSRSSDRIIANSSETDEKGLASFVVSSGESGVSTLTATDESAGTVLSSRLKIIFVKAAGVYKEIGGDPATILLAQSGPTASRFLIDNMPATMHVNESVSFRVTAFDGSGNVIPSYVGRIVFTSSDQNATKPNAYTFQSADQGRKTFDLGLSFRTVGSQTFTVQEDGNALVKGEKTVEVVAAAAAGGGAGQVRITKPATGTYSLNVLEVAGEATPSARVKIFDNGQQITEVVANTSGRFSYNTSLLRDGQHTFHAESSGVQSLPVTITIDSTPARVEQVDLSKTNLAPGDTAELSIRSDPDLTSIQATLGDVINDLKPDPENPGMYRGTITAPAQSGDYTINVIIVDKVGNTSAPEEAGKIHVDASLKTNTGATFSVPSKVQGVHAAAGNGRVALSWQAAMAESGIALYRIYHGTNPQQLQLIANTNDGATTWFIPNLQNGTQYYFRVAGVDSKGNEGDNLSEMVTATPLASLTNPDDGGAPVLCDPEPCPPAPPAPLTPQDGPEVYGMIVASLIGSGVVRRFWRKK